MAVGDIQKLRDHLPDVFGTKPPPDLLENAYFSAVDDISSMELTEVEKTLFNLDENNLDVYFSDFHGDNSVTFPGDDEHFGNLIQKWSHELYLRSPQPTLQSSLSTTGPSTWAMLHAPHTTSLSTAGSGVGLFPATDAWAFYLEYHYYDNLWGIYLTIEGVRDFSSLLYVIARSINRRLPFHTCILAARHFLFRHELFHHNTECFATRLEVTHREPLYRTAFEKIYRKTAGKAGCMEEALANAYACRQTLDDFSGDPNRDNLESVLERYIGISPPGYREAVHYLSETDFVEGRNHFAEMNQREALPKHGYLSDEIWDMFPHAFNGMAQINSSVSYLIPRSSPLLNRVLLNNLFRLIPAQRLAKGL